MGAIGGIRTRAISVLLVLAASGCALPGSDPAGATVQVAITASPTIGPTPAPIASQEPTPSPRPAESILPPPSADPVPTPGPARAFAMNLYQPGDFVPQHTFDWCVGASIQMAHNLVRTQNRSSYEDQQALWEMARDRSSNSFNGANPHGWAEALTEIGFGPYRLVSIPDYHEALRVAAAALRQTSRPVGLVMWRGRHAWVMSGFESMGDPSERDDFTVTGVRVLDPLYPHGSGTWGPSPAPNTLLTPDELSAQFVIREPRRWSAGLEAGYLLVLPQAPVAGQALRPAS